MYVIFLKNSFEPCHGGIYSPSTSGVPTETWHNPRREGDMQLDRAIDGSCLCGFIRYEATIDDSRVRICHCTQCQIHSASAFRTGVLVHRDNFKLTHGQLKTHIKTAESSSRRILTFCPECGTSIYGSGVEDQTFLSLRLGTATQRAELVPSAHMWYRSAVPWLSSLMNLPTYEKGMPPAASQPCVMDKHQRD